MQTLVIFHLNLYHALVTGLPMCSIKPLQLIQNVAACLIFHQPKRTCHTTVHMSAMAFTGPHQVRSSDICLQIGHLNSTWTHVSRSTIPLTHCGAAPKQSSSAQWSQEGGMFAYSSSSHFATSILIFKNLSLFLIQLNLTKLPHLRTVFVLSNLATLFALYWTCMSLWIKVSSKCLNVNCGHTQTIEKQ